MRVLKFLVILINLKTLRSLDLLLRSLDLSLRFIKLLVIIIKVKTLGF